MNVSFVPLSLASLTADNYEEKPANFCTVLWMQSMDADELQMEVAGTSQKMRNVPEQGQVPKAEVGR